MLPGAAPMLVGLIAPVGIPYYFFRFLPAGRPCVASLAALGIWMLMLLLYGVAAMASGLL